MTRALVIGDFHIPTRAKNLPEPLERKILQETFDLVLCTGDLVDPSIMDFLSKLGKLYVVQGNMDFLRNPVQRRLKIENFTVGLIHGTGIYPRGDVKKLTRLALEMDVDILISGHTHKASINEVDVDGRKVLLLNPGSATGVWSGGFDAGPPSFMILDFSKNEVIVHLYELEGDKLKETVYQFRR
mgnify:CR=1 FL=1